MKQEYDLVIKGGKVVFPDGVFVKDIGVREGIIAEISDEIKNSGTKVINAKGLYIFPGMIDIHVHFDEPNRAEWEGFLNGSKVMAAGGCTTYFDMPLNGNPPTVTVSDFREKKKLAENNSYVDFALWGGLIPGNLNELEGMAELGAIGFKAFMPSAGSEFPNVDDVTLYRGMQKISDLNKVLAIHAESDFIVQKLKEEMIREGNLDALSYADSRPVIAEMEAVNKALLFAEYTGCAIHFVHISSYQTVELITRAKRNGINVSVETCPHYLLFNRTDFALIGAEAKCAPPLRDEEERVKLWEHLKNNEIDIVASDHSPCPSFMKQDFDADMFEAWGGISGGQFSMEMIIGEGHWEQGIPLNDLSRLLSTTPAVRFGLFPQKGVITEGADADLVIMDLNKRRTIQQEELLSKHRHSIYIGQKVLCSIISTFVRGKLVYQRESEINGEKTGSFVHADK